MRVHLHKLHIISIQTKSSFPLTGSLAYESGTPVPPEAAQDRPLPGQRVRLFLCLPGRIQGAVRVPSWQEP